MPERRAVTFDLAGLPACHRCHAPAIVERDRYGLQHVTWRHERTCRVLRSARERKRLNAALGLACRVEPPVREVTP